jgi:MipA family protein
MRVGAAAAGAAAQKRLSTAACHAGDEPATQRRLGRYRGDRIIRSLVAWRRVAACQRKAAPGCAKGRAHRSVEKSQNVCIRQILATTCTMHCSAPCRITWESLCSIAWLLLAATAHAQNNAELPAAAATASAPDSPRDSPPAKAAKGPAFEGAVGLTLAYRPEYLGASRSRFRLTPGVYLRYGRLTASNAGGFATRRADDVVPGVALDVVRSERARLGASLRFDGGRAESTSAAFKGLGNIRPTLRLRTGASWQVQGPWRVGASWSVDVLGRGGGGTGDISGGWETKFSADTSLNVGAGLGFANSRYLQNQFGISPSQAANTGYPVYEPCTGWRDMGLNVSLRHDMNWGADERWIVIGGANVSRLIGPAAASPLTTARNGWGLSVGVARQF